MKAMSIVKIGFSGLNVPDQIQRTREITTAMTGNPTYLTPSPALNDVDDKADEVETAYQESRGGDKDKLAILRLRRKELLVLISLLAQYVQFTSGGDEEKILSSGFDVRKVNAPHPDTAGQVPNLRLSEGSNIRKVKAMWDKADDAVIYFIESDITPDFNNAEARGFTTRLQKEIGEFTQGQRIWIRVFAIGREKPGPASEPVSIIVK